MSIICLQSGNIYLRFLVRLKEKDARTKITKNTIHRIKLIVLHLH
jgi:hypothetical protein